MNRLEKKLYDTCGKVFTEGVKIEHILDLGAYLSAIGLSPRLCSDVETTPVVILDGIPRQVCTITTDGDGFTEILLEPKEEGND